MRQLQIQAFGFHHIAAAIFFLLCFSCGGGSENAAPSTPRLNTMELRLVAGSNHTCLLMAGRNPPASQKARVLCWGSNEYGQIDKKPMPTSGNKDIAWNQPYDVEWLKDSTLLSLTETDTCTVKIDKQVECMWGESRDNRAIRTISSTPFLNQIRMLASGNQHTCALTENGSILCFGENGHRQLGALTTISSTITDGNSNLETCIGPTKDCEAASRIAPSISQWSELHEPRDEKFGALYVGGATTCGATSDGLSCWGLMGEPEKNSGRAAIVWNISVPVEQLNPQCWSHIELSMYSGCALRNGREIENATGCPASHPGDVWCWGVNNHGQLGATGQTNASQIIPVPNLHPAKALGMGADFSCALGFDEKVYCWGANDVGQLGRETAGNMNDPHPRPVLLEGKPLESVAQIALHGGRHACALKSSGEIICWGANNRGQIGNGKMSDSAVDPIVVYRVPPTY